MIKFVCTDKRRLKQGEIRARYVGACFKKGLSIGFAQGIRQEQRRVARLQAQVVPTPPATPLRITPMGTPLMTPVQTPRVTPRVTPASTPRAPAERRSLAVLLNNRPNKKIRTIDFLTTLPTPGFNLSTRDKKRLGGTEALKNWLINTTRLYRA